MEEKGIYENVATNCSKFYPRFDAFRSCPEVSKASCLNCRNFEEMRCKLNLFDTIALNNEEQLY